MGLDGFDKISNFASLVKNGDERNMEAIAAQEYFQCYHKGLNRRTSDPVNSALNYGYAILRSYIIKALISTGLHCSLGIHHHNETNTFNLADDLIEPWRAFVDCGAFLIIGNELNLSHKQRKELTGVLHKECKINGKTTQVSTGIELMVDSFKNAIVHEDEELLKLPTLVSF